MIALLLATALGWNTPNFDGRPPARYRHGRISVRVYFDNHAHVAANCGGDGPGDLVVNACSIGPPNIIYAPDPCKYRGAYALMFCHELGHLRGWDGNHPR